jgi:hypothetical protein
VDERSNSGGRGEGDPEAGARVRALRAAYHGGRLVVTDDEGALERARLRDGHAIDARDVADAMLRDRTFVQFGRLGLKAAD